MQLVKLVKYDVVSELYDNKPQRHLIEEIT